MNWITVIQWVGVAFVMLCAGWSILNAHKYHKIFKRQMDEADLLVRNLSVLDFDLDMHRLRFALYCAMSSSDVSDDAKDVIATAIAQAKLEESRHGTA